MVWPTDSSTCPRQRQLYYLVLDRAHIAVSLLCEALDELDGLLGSLLLDSCLRAALGFTLSSAALFASRLKSATLLFPQTRFELGAELSLYGLLSSIPVCCSTALAFTLFGSFGVGPSGPFRQRGRIGTGEVIENLYARRSALARYRFCLPHEFLQKQWTVVSG
jgi:hypothetical protein